MVKMVLVLYNTWTKKKEVFKPIEPGKVGYYSCGPTVYSSSHLGHGVTYIRTDMLKQFLKKWKGFVVKHVQNITDFGHMTSDADEGIDKIKKAMDREKKTAEDITEFYTNDFHDSMKKLKIEPPDVEPKASENVDIMIEIIKKIIENGYAYVKDGTVYFDVSKYKDYGKLSGKNMEAQEEKQRVADPNKKNPNDFVLWAKHQPGHSHVWDSPWGKGMPGWHIECSAMGRKYLDGDFDIHSGGVDHYFPHHENEIAQNYGAFGSIGVNYWIHFGLLSINGEKMSKSKENFITISDALEKFSPETIRMWVFSSQYKSTLDYSEDNLRKAKEKVDKINNFIQSLLKIADSADDKIETDLVKKYYEKFEAAMDDNLNTPEALAVIFDLITEANKKIDSKSLTKKEAADILALLEKIDTIFKMMNFKKEKIEIPEEVKKLIQEREKARTEKNWKKADEIRGQIRKMSPAISK
ncbi:MAG: cysteine--tRNA ligase [Candidatus Aenigmarchaeota archaeon ex4484_14]|nr:MAG: cysteine--tRNA ligase [Candidatus Aenigmarchaeota archaeon ex4484_14]